MITSRLAFYSHIFTFTAIALFSCTSSTPPDDQQLSEETSTAPDNRMAVVLDTDANNELDDQHAIAYLLFNQDVFDIKGITVNATYNGGGIESHVEEAERVVELCGYESEIPIIAGASGSYADIVGDISTDDFDGYEAVQFIIDQVLADTSQKTVLIPIGKLTNITLAVRRAPEIIPHITVMWLGSNWPQPGEYNLKNDTTSVNPLLNEPGLDFQICTVRYGEPSGTAAVTASVSEIRDRMPGLGPTVAPVEGRHGASFTYFGDYSINLFENTGDSVRALFDVCALAILKNENWASAQMVPAPILKGEAWVERPNNTRRVVFWENFDRSAIMKDFYQTMEQAAGVEE